MLFKRFAVPVISLGAALALTLGTAGAASAQTVHRPKHHKPSPVTQVSGAKLQTALLPASDFGSGYTSSNAQNTGNSLWSSHGSLSVSGTPCDAFVDSPYLVGYGDTAATANLVSQPESGSSNPDAVLLAFQGVAQFASSQSAGSFYGQSLAKYTSCQSFSDSSSDGSGGTVTLTITVQSTANTSVDKYQAFEVSQSAEISDSSSDINGTIYLNTTVVNAGTNIYLLTEWNQSNDGVASWLLTSMINRAQALYKR
jgi:hypothetical protein